MISNFRDNYWFLSNFYSSSISLDGLVYPTVEHAYQAAKSTDVTDRIKIQGAATAAEAKRLGRRVNMRPDWEQVRDDVMLQSLRLKFAPGTPLAVALLETGDQELVEENFWGDTYWGACGGVGENKLGKLLMQVRKELSA